MKKEAPITGSGMVTKSAPNLVKIPKTIINTAEYCTTHRLPTYSINNHNVMHRKGQEFVKYFKPCFTFDAPTI